MDALDDEVSPGICRQSYSLQDWWLKCFSKVIPIVSKHFFVVRLQRPSAPHSEGPRIRQTVPIVEAVKAQEPTRGNLHVKSAGATQREPVI